MWLVEYLTSGKILDPGVFRPGNAQHQCLTPAQKRGQRLSRERSAAVSSVTGDTSKLSYLRQSDLTTVECPGQEEKRPERLLRS